MLEDFFMNLLNENERDMAIVQTLLDQMMTNLSNDNIEKQNGGDQLDTWKKELNDAMER